MCYINRYYSWRWMQYNLKDYGAKFTPTPHSREFRRQSSILKNSYSASNESWLHVVPGSLTL